MQRRNAATLVEVLVAIFIMGIGLLSILALFPLGAYRMAEAIKSSRCAAIAENADAIARMWQVRSPGTLISGLMPNPPQFDPYLNPNPPGGPPAPIAGTAQGASYPVFIDPTGYITAAGTGYGNWLGGSSSYGIPRLTVNFVQTGPPFPPNVVTSQAAAQANALRWFALPDDITFNKYGLPDLTVVGSPYLERDIRYSWAYLCQRPAANNTSVVNLNTVVYNRRPLTLSGNVSLPEYAYGGNGNNTYFDLTRSTVVIDFSATPGVLPPVRVGEWILDATPDPVSGIPHAAFYRVVSINQTGPNVAEYEVQTPFSGFPPGTTQYGNGTTQIVNVMVLEGVVEVFARPGGF